MIEIDGTRISIDHPPYMIAEISANHNGEIDQAKSCIRAAKFAGASAVKIQTYTPDTMTLQSSADDFLIKTGPWRGYTLYELYAEAHTPFEWHEQLFQYAKELNISLFSSAFDETAVDLLERLNTPAYKIASFELLDLPLIEYIARTKKPIIMSTGMGSEHEIGEAVEVVLKYGISSVLLMHCISSYPAPLEDANLHQISWLKKHFKVETGLSDHTIGDTCAAAAIALGASAIEKHFTLSRSDKGPDSAFSIEPDEFSRMSERCFDTWQSLGREMKVRPAVEADSLVFRRSIYFIKDMKCGESISRDSIRRIRPGYGLAPKYFDMLIGKTLSADVKRGQAVKWEHVSCKAPEP